LKAFTLNHLLDRSLVGCSYTLHLVVLANLWLDIEFRYRLAD
jgi:hypothetical protein